MLRASWIGAILVFVTLASWWYTELLDSREEAIEGQVPRVRDYYIKQFTKTVMDANGRPERILNADLLNHYHDNTSELFKPELTMVDRQRPPWVMRAETGLVAADADQLYLGGEVNIERTGDEKRSPIKILTKDLTVKLNQNYAESETYTEIVRLGNRISATGARVYFGHPARVDLNSAVRGHYKVR